jgi:hypothetical protein
MKKYVYDEKNDFFFAGRSGRETGVFCVLGDRELV